MKVGPAKGLRHCCERARRGHTIDVLPCIETSIRRGRKTLRTLSYVEAVRGLWLRLNDIWVQGNQLEKRLMQIFHIFIHR